MRSILTVALCALALLVASCSDTPTTTSDTRLGKMTLDEFTANQSYSVWFNTGYQSYPDPQSTTQQARFDTAVAKLSKEFDSTYSVLMVLKPTCSCQKTQLYMPQVVRALDAAGFPRKNITVYVTDNRFAGIDDIKTKYGLADAPVFIVLRGDVEKGRIYLMPSTGSTIEEDLASIFAKP